MNLNEVLELLLEAAEVTLPPEIEKKLLKFEKDLKKADKEAKADGRNVSRFQYSKFFEDILVPLREELSSTVIINGKIENKYSSNRRFKIQKMLFDRVYSILKESGRNTNELVRNFKKNINKFNQDIKVEKLQIDKEKEELETDKNPNSIEISKLKARQRNTSFLGKKFIPRKDAKKTTSSTDFIKNYYIKLDTEDKKVEAVKKLLVTKMKRVNFDLTKYHNFLGHLKEIEVDGKVAIEPDIIKEAKVLASYESNKARKDVGIEEIRTFSYQAFCYLNKYLSPKDFVNKAYEELPKEVETKRLFKDDFIKAVEETSKDEKRKEEIIDLINERESTYGRQEQLNKDASTAKVQTGEYTYGGSYMHEERKGTRLSYVQEKIKNRVSIKKALSDSILKAHTLLKSDVVYKRENKPHKNVRIEVKNKGGSGDLIKKALENGETIEVKNIIWSSFLARAKNETEEDLNTYNEIVDVFKKEEKYFNRILNKEIKENRLKKYPKEKGRLLLSLGDIDSSMKDYNIRINLKNRTDDLNFHISNLKNFQGDEDKSKTEHGLHILLDIKNISKNDILNVGEIARRNEAKREKAKQKAESKLLNTRNALLGSKK